MAVAGPGNSAPGSSVHRGNLLGTPPTLPGRAHLRFVLLTFLTLSLVVSVVLLVSDLTSSSLKGQVLLKSGVCCGPLMFWSLPSGTGNWTETARVLASWPGIRRAISAFPSRKRAIPPAGCQAS